MSSQGSRGSGQHADAPPSRHAPGPKLQVQRSLSRDTITIHFSALGKEEDDEEEELYGMPTGAKPVLDVAGAYQGLEASVTEDQTESVTVGLEAREELFTGVEASPGAAVLPVSLTTVSVQPSDLHSHKPSPAMTIISTSTHPQLSSTPPASSSWPSDRPLANPPSTSSSSSSPCKSAALSSPKPFLSLVRSLSNDIDSRETTPAPATVIPSHARHRHLMKSLVKSLSTDTSRAEHQEGPLLQQRQQLQPSHRPPPRNMQLFKQFSQPRLSSSPVAVTQAGGDSKTAPSSPIMSPDGRSFFKVQEVEAKIEDTKRRLSEVISDPLQLFSKIIGDESGVGGLGSATRSKSLSSSASELSGGATVNGHAEGNSNYSIKEEEGVEGEEEEEEEETPTGKAPDSSFFSFPSLAPPSSLTQAYSSTIHKSPSLTLGRCSMSALVARQEDEDFCELYSEDFELCTDTETPDDQPGSRKHHTDSTGLCSELDIDEEEKAGEETATVPVIGLVFLTQLVYWYLVFPVPPCVCAVVHGIVAGFMLALLVLWLSSPRRLSSGPRRGIEQWDGTQLEIKEPGIFKVR